MKYDNTLPVMYRFLFIFYLGLLVFYAATGYSSNGEFGYFVYIALFVFCLISQHSAADILAHRPLPSPV